MLSRKDMEVINHCVEELLVELNYKHIAKISGKNNARKLESIGYVELIGYHNKKGGIEIKINFRDFNDGRYELERLSIL